METITIVAIDDHPLIRQAVRSLVNEKENMELVGEGATGDDVLVQMEKHKPDVLLLDLSMPQSKDEDGRRFLALPTISKLAEHYPETAIIVLTQHYVPALIRGAIKRGVNGYLLKGDDLSMSLPGAIETVSRGSIYFSETISQRLFYDDAKRNENVSLTDRQIEVLNAIYSSPDALYSRLAEDLGITQPTFKRHLTKSFIALGVTNKTSAMIRCRELGLIRSD